MKQLKVLILLLFVFIGCNPPINNKLYDVVHYSNIKYEKIMLENVEIVNSRLEIKEKYFEIGLIKTNGHLNNYLLKEIAAKNGANIIISEGNSNYTLARFINQKKEDVKDEGIKT